MKGELGPKRDDQLSDAGAVEPAWRYRFDNRISNVLTLFVCDSLTAKETHMAYVTHAELAAAEGAELIGSELPYSGAGARTVQDRMSDRVSLLDFIPVHLHPAIRMTRDGAVDLSAYIQAAIDAVPPGATIYAPSGVYRMDEPVVAERSITLCGDPGRETMDNSWDHGNGGTVFDYHGTTGTAFTFAPPVDSGRANVVLRDFLVWGARFKGGVSGHCIEVHGSGHTVAVRLLIDNVHCCEASEHGLYMHSAVYGGTIDNVFAHRNGKNGLRLVGGNNIGIGEMKLGRIRSFDNGRSASSDQDKAGMLWLGGSLLADQISCSENRGPGLIIGGGPGVINMLQLESNNRLDDEAGSYPNSAGLIIGQLDSGVQSLIIHCLLSAVIQDFHGAHILISSNAHRVHIHGGFLDDSLEPGNCHIRRENGATELVYDGLGSSVPLLIEDRTESYDTHHMVQVYARQQATGAALTGDGADVFWAPDVEILDSRNAYDAATGTFTAPATGLYDIEAIITLTGLTAMHDRAAVIFAASSGNHVYRMGNVGAMRDASNQLVLQARARIPLQQADTVRVAFNVGGAAPTVSFLGGGETGFLSIVTAH